MYVLLKLIDPEENQSTDQLPLIIATATSVAASSLGVGASANNPNEAWELVRAATITLLPSTKLIALPKSLLSSRNPVWPHLRSPRSPSHSPSSPGAVHLGRSILKEEGARKLFAGVGMSYAPMRACLFSS
jgi:hypothetical protein